MPTWTDQERSRLLLAIIELLVPPRTQNRLPPWPDVAERMGAGFTSEAVRYLIYKLQLTASQLIIPLLDNNIKSSGKMGFQMLGPSQTRLSEIDSSTLPGQKKHLPDAVGVGAGERDSSRNVRSLKKTIKKVMIIRRLKRKMGNRGLGNE